MTPIPRKVEPERLDSLAIDDPEAVQSRRDLQRLNAIMGHAGAIAGTISSHAASARIRRIVDLGGGDGTMLLRVARRLAGRGHARTAVVVDRHPSLSDRTRAGFEALGWTVEPVAAQVEEWLAADRHRDGTVAISNLFLHHFAEASLAALLERIASRTDLLVALEPRRTRFNLGAVRLVGLIGCNSLTRDDGILSVRAGFDHQELSNLWPTGTAWHLDERPFHLFSHAFVARRLPG